MQKSKGAISIFLIIILMSSFLLGGFFIDASRILVAKRKVKMAMNTAARSTLAHYDTILVGEYGIYGLEHSKADELFKKYFDVNMKRGTSEDIKIYQYTITNSGAQAKRPLSDADTLKRQITEYEKYRAPVNMTIGVVSKVKDALGSLSQGAKFADDGAKSADKFKGRFNVTAGNVKESMKGLKEHIVDDASKRLKQFTDKEIKNAKEALDIDFLSDGDIDNIFSELDGKVNEMTTNLQEVNTEISDFLNEEKEIEKNIGNVKNELKGNYGANYENNEDMQEAIDKNPKAATTPLDEQAKNKMENIQKAINDTAEQVRTTKSNIKAANDAYKRAVGVYNDKVVSYDNEKANSGISEKENQQKEKNKSIDNLEKEINKYFSGLMPIIDADYRDSAKEYYNDYRYANGGENTKNEVQNDEKLDDATKLYLLYEIFPKCDNIMNLSKENTLLEAEINKANQQVQAAEDAVNSAYSELKDAKKALDDAIESVKNIGISINDSDTELSIAQIEKDAKEILGESNIMGILNSVISLGRRIEPVPSGANSDDINDKNPLSLFSKLGNYISGMINRLSGLEGIRNECYMIDYIMERNTYLTSQSGYNHWFGCGEVEYIIFGDEMQISNIIKAVGSIYIMRFAIDTIDYFIQSPDLEIISRLITAAARGAWQAGNDLLDMIVVSGAGTGDSAEGCPICPSLSKFGVKLTYSDHLRLFMLINIANNDTRLVNAMNATLEKEKKSVPISNLYTEIECSAEVEVNMIILSMFKLDVLSGGNFRNGNYVIKERIVEGY